MNPKLNQTINMLNKTYSAQGSFLRLMNRAKECLAEGELLEPLHAITGHFACALKLAVAWCPEAMAPVAVPVRASGGTPEGAGGTPAVPGTRPLVCVPRTGRPPGKRAKRAAKAAKTARKEIRRGFGVTRQAKSANNGTLGVVLEAARLLGTEFRATDVHRAMPELAHKRISNALARAVRAGTLEKTGWFTYRFAGDGEKVSLDQIHREIEGKAEIHVPRDADAGVYDGQ
jgi:hypothetical protein